MRPRAVPVMLTAAERKTLKTRVRGAKTPYRDRVRAQIVRAAARGHAHERIAAELRVGVDTVRKWRGRFAEHGLGGLVDLPRSGRPRRITALERAAVVALACQLPAATGVGLARWTGPELAAELTAQGLVNSPVSASSILRILSEHPVKPWQYQSWIYPRDPNFTTRASVVLDLYQGRYQGEPLRPGDRILSVDAKPSIQARGRCHPTLPAAPGKPARVEHEYVRNGALALLAALDVHTGKVFASTPKTTGIAPFMTLMAQVMSQPEYANAPRVFVIVDSHRQLSRLSPAVVPEVRQGPYDTTFADHARSTVNCRALQVIRVRFHARVRLVVIANREGLATPRTDACALQIRRRRPARPGRGHPAHHGGLGVFGTASQVLDELIRSL